MLKQVVCICRETLLKVSLISLLGGLHPLHACIIEENADQAGAPQTQLPFTMVEKLRASTFNKIKYAEGSFPSVYDELAQIGSTDSFKGKGKSSNTTFSSESAKILIPGTTKENGKCKITSPSTAPVQQKNLFPGKDGRARLDHQKTQEWPYRIQGHMIMKFPDETCTGSGILVGPHHVLTAGHNLYNPDNQKWAKEVFFAPGRDENHYPYGDSKGSILLVHTKWHEGVRQQKDDYDFGMVILDSPIGLMTGWSGLLCLPDALLKEWPISVTGYPGDKGAGNYHSTQMWTMAETIKDKSVKPEQLFYEIDTYEGQSGSGVWGERWLGYEGVYTVGIHTGRETNEAQENRGIRLSKGKFDVILTWLKTYQLDPSFFKSQNVLQAPLKLDTLTFLEELGQEHESWRQRAKGGEKEALYHLGSLYHAKKDYQKAFTCFYLAAQNEAETKGLEAKEAEKKQYGPALTALGLCYEQGQGVEKHPLKAVSLYQKARAKKNAEASRRLGLLYLEGRILPKKVETAEIPLKEAARQGDGEACYRLAELYDKEQEVKQGKAYATQLYQQAEKMGYTLPQSLHTSIRPLSEEEVRNQAFTKIFKASLQQVNTIASLQQEASKLTLFICYDTEDASHRTQIEKLATDLVLSGIPEKNIYLDTWANRPGSSLTKFQHADRIFEAARVLVIGSPDLKEKYERKEGGRGISSLQIENLLTRITRQGVKGIIPLWFKDQQEKSFPSTLQNIDQYCLGGDYFRAFFSLLENVFQWSVTGNPIQSIKDNFEEKRLTLTSDFLTTYKTKVEDEEKKKNEKHINELKDILGI